MGVLSKLFNVGAKGVKFSRKGKDEVGVFKMLFLCDAVGVVGKLFNVGTNGVNSCSMILWTDFIDFNATGSINL